MAEKTKSTGREEDYRDYEERDIAEGWPYADAQSSGETGVANGAYGQGAENFDEAENPGFERSVDTTIETADGPDLLGENTEADVDDDSLEETIGTALEDNDIDASSLEVRVRRGSVTLTGSVDSNEDRSRIAALVSAIPGVSRVRNDLTASGVDAGIPADWDD